MFYQIFFEQGQDSMFIIRESDGRIIKVNDAAVKTYGYSRDEMLIMCLQDLFDSETVNTIESIKGGTLNECTIETRHGRKDSSTFPVEVSIKSVATEEGILLLGTVRDMTKRGSALEKIKKAWERQPLNIENMTDITEQKRAEEIFSRELDISAALADLSGKLLSPASIEDISGIVLDHAQRLTDSRYGYVGYIERDTGYLNCSTLTRSVWDECKIEDKCTIYNKFGDLGGWVVKNKEPILTNQPRQDPRSAGLPLGHIPIERLLSVPAIYNGTLLGIVSLANSSRDYHEQDLVLAKRLAALFAITVQRKWSEDDLRTLLSINGAPLVDRSGRIEGAVLSIQNVTGRKEAEERITSYQKQLRSLAAKLTLAEERERRCIAEGIHDHIGQSLAICRLKIGALKRAASLEAVLESIDEIIVLIEEVIMKTRSLTFELSPPILYDLGFGAAVEWLGEQILERNGVKVSLKNELQSKSLDEEVRIILFTAVRELFFNIIKHARAQNVFISIKNLGVKVRVTVKDDGIGFETYLFGPSPGKTVGYGLFSIKERLEHLGGCLEIISRPGFGTSVAIEAPFK